MQKWQKYTKLPQNIPNGHKIYQFAVEYTKWPQNIPTSSISRPSKIYRKWDFWFRKYTIWQPCLQTKLFFPNK
jgi:hypothetical protein